jgi:hypothetical protein
MRIHRTAFHALQILFFIIAPVLVAGFIYGTLYFISPDKGSDTSIQANAERLRASAQIYYSRLFFYDGVCSDIGVARPFQCNESSTAYAIEARLSNDKYYCVDSVGFAGVVPWSIGSHTKCR